MMGNYETMIRHSFVHWILSHRYVIVKYIAMQENLSFQQARSFSHIKELKKEIAKIHNQYFKRTTNKICRNHTRLIFYDYYFHFNSINTENMHLSN